MHNRIILIIILLVSSCLVAVGQNNTATTLGDFAGKWKADMEKSFSSSERKKITNYTVVVSESNGTLTVLAEFMRDGIPTRMNDVYLIDGKEHSLDDIFGDVRAYTGKLKGTTVKITFHKSLGQNRTTYLDQRTFKLSSDKNTLTIEPCAGRPNLETPQIATQNGWFFCGRNEKGSRPSSTYFHKSNCRKYR